MRIVADVDEVAVEQHRHADADRRTRHRRDDRLVEIQQRVHELHDWRVFTRWRLLHEVLQIVARREHIRLADDQHRAHGLVRKRRIQRLRHRFVHRQCQRVLLLRPRDFERRHAIRGRGPDAHRQPAA